MNTGSRINAIERKVLLSTLWIFVVLNYLYCDVVSLMDSNLLKQYLIGSVGGIEFTQGFLLGAGVLVAIWIAMVLLSRVLEYSANRWVNIVAGILATAIQFASLVLKRPALYYLSFSVIEMAGTLLIFWFALKWRNPAGSAKDK